MLSSPLYSLVYSCFLLTVVRVSSMEEQCLTGAPCPSASFPSTFRYQQIERFLNSRDVVVLFEYCNLKNDAILGELRVNSIINREQQQMMSETVQVTANKIVREALLGDPSESKLKKLGEILMRSESDANKELAKSIATFLQPDTEMRATTTSRDVVDFEYYNLKDVAILGELRINGIINREQQQKMMSETVQVTANNIVGEALLEDPSEKKLKTFGEILKRSESEANQKLADGIATFLQPDEIRTTTPPVPTPPSGSNIPNHVHYVIMTANMNRWKSAQYFLGVDCDVSEKVKGQTFQDDEDLAPKMKGINPEISMGGTTYQFFTVNQKAAVLMKCSDIGSFSHQGSLLETFKLLNIGWPLKAIFIVGCCGAMWKAEEDQIGSVFVGEKLYYYGLGKITEGGIFKSRFDPYRLDSLGCETLEGKGSPRIKNIKTVSILSGDFVMKDEHAADERCTRLEEKQVGFEMEGVGVVMAVNLHKELDPSKILPKIVLLKGVSDHADAMKNEDHKSFMFFSKEIPNVDEDTRQQMCTIMSLTVALRAICNGFLD